MKTRQMKAVQPGLDCTPLLIKGAVVRTGDTYIPGYYCHQQHLWIVDGTPIVEARSGLAELSTKTDSLTERDDSSENFLLEMQTKTKAELERDDQDFNLLELITKTHTNIERDD